MPIALLSIVHVLMIKPDAHLRDKLHVTVFDTVVDHLDVVTRTLCDSELACKSTEAKVYPTVTDPLAAWLAVALRRYRLQHILDVRPCLFVATRHNGRAISSTLLTTRHTSADEADTLPSEVLSPAIGVWIMRVATIDDDIALLNAALGKEELYELVDSLASLDKQHHTPRRLELLHKLFDAVGADNRLALGFVLQETIDLGNCAVEGNDGEAVVGHVEDQVLTHDGQADEAKISSVTCLLDVIVVAVHDVSEASKRVERIICMYLQTISGGERTKLRRSMKGADMEGE
jgi:hypothetical protein